MGKKPGPACCCTKKEPIHKPHLKMFAEIKPGRGGPARVKKARFSEGA